jgi:excisionase family DNA binding protein
LSEEAQKQRSDLLNLLFGSDVPTVLEGNMLRTSDVALLFEVSERTVSEWAKKGQIPSVRTPGGHRRYPAAGIKAALEQSRGGTASAGAAGGGQQPDAVITPFGRRYPA